MKMELKKIVEKDQVLAVLNEFSDVFPHLCEKIESLDSYAEKLSRYAEFYVGLDATHPVGVVAFYANDQKSQTAYITLIGLKKDYRGTGLGKRLLAHCEEIAKEHGMAYLNLEVDCDNSHAISFYTRNGFLEIGKTDRNSFYMRKNLD